MIALPIPIDAVPAEWVPALLVAASAAVVLVARRAGPRQVRAAEAIRGVAFRRFHPLDGRLGRLIPPTGEPRDLTREKDDDEYVLTAQSSPIRLYRALMQNDWTYNPTSTKKYRTVERNGEPRKQYSRGSFAFRDHLMSARQLHAYFFVNTDGTIDVYAHKEDSAVSNPSEHTDAGDMIEGDPEGRLRAVLEADGIEVETQKK